MTNLSIPDTITSLEIAEISGKPHSDLMKAIRKMEPAWIKEGEGNFSLSYYTTSQNKEMPMYRFNKTECLYIFSKFNDEIRAKLVKRWKELESSQIRTRPPSRKELALLVIEQEEQIEDLQAKGTYEFEAREQVEKELKLFKRQVAMEEDASERNSMYRR